MIGLIRVLTIDLLRALGIAPPVSKNVPSVVGQPAIRLNAERKRPHEEEDHDLREENKRLKVSCADTRSDNRWN